MIANKHFMLLEKEDLLVKILNKIQISDLLVMWNKQKYNKQKYNKQKNYNLKYNKLKSHSLSKKLKQLNKQLK